LKTLAERAREIDDDLLGGGGGDFVFDVDSVKAAEEEIAGVGHDGAATRGEAVLCEEEQETGEELVDLGGGLELGEVAEEFGGESGIIGLMDGGTEVVARAEPGAGVASLVAAAASGGSAVATAREPGVSGGWLSGLRLRIHFGTAFLFSNL
jgi:hypothetical protein